jgi:hypothetical protein
VAVENNTSATHLIDSGLPPSSLRHVLTLLRNLLQRLEVNRAVGYLLLSRGWQLVSGIVSIVLLSRCMEPQQRDLYYLFGSLIGMQMLVELGLPGIIVLLTSHEWSKLHLDEAVRVQGDAGALARAANLQRVMERWFVVGACVFVGVVIARGYSLMQGTTVIDWQAPWLLLVIVTALAIPFVPKMAFLEGGQQITTINRLRLGQSVSGSLVVWGVLLAGGGLWSLVASGIVRWGWEFFLVQVRYQATFASLRAHRTGDAHLFRREIWPLGWRIALQTIGSYFGSLYLFQVVESLQTVGATGRWGMTWQVLSGLQMAALAWVNTRSPEFGVLAAQGQHGELRRRMLKTGLISLAVFGLGTGGFLVALSGLHWVSPKHANGFLGIPEATLMAAGFAAMLITNQFHMSVRYDKRDPFLIPHTISAASTVALAWWGANRWGATGVVVAYAAVAGLFTLPVAIGIAMHHARRRSMV